MTRFARAKGSKASNERVPEDATSWHEMKRQMKERLCELEEETKRKKVRAEIEAASKQFSSNVVGTVKWASFQDVSLKKNLSQNKKIKKNKRAAGSTEEKERNVADKQVETIDSKEAADDSDDAPTEMSAKIRPIEVLTKPMKRKKERIVIGTVNVGPNVIKEQKPEISEQKSNEQSEDDFQKKGKKKKRKRRQTEENDKPDIGNKQENAESNEDNKNLPLKKSNDLKKHNVNQQHERNGASKRKLPKIMDNKEHMRRKPLIEDTMIELNGRKVELKYFGGFLIKKEDANRLFKLRNELRKKGVPQREMDLTLKLERRKAEKALAREKKKLCFHCRQSGHELSECPNLKGGPNAHSIATDICFKCGSTEHTHFECKVVRGENYKFATCFICKEEGHISKQCPDNPRGIYPQGGACRICQDVTHLKKDCPLFQQQQESANTTLNKMGFADLEALEAEDKQNVKRKKVNPKKIVKFKA